ncbi:hypothetical protein MMC17_006820 [Xylographa soralifera]|nr:hypothetical protein [Xylographa soralifera]
MVITNDQEMANRGLKRLAADSSDSEWEYEYHETETESFFVVLDLPSAPSTKKRKRAEESTDNPSTPNNASTQTPDRDTSLQDPLTPKADLTASPEPENRIQILDLHTREPVISYKNQVYTCQWTSTIGTDILLTPPDSAPLFPPLYEAPGFNVLATTNIKLVGEPVQLIPRSKGVRPTTAQADSSHIPATTDSAIAFRSSDVTHAAVVTQSISQPLRALPATPRRLAPSAGMSTVRQSQGRFLERLVALKAARGEQDEVILHHRPRPNDNGWKTWTDGGGRARLRRMQAAAEGEDGYYDGNSDEGWGDDSEDLDGSDEDDDVGEGAVDGAVGVDGPGKAAAAFSVADTAEE